MDVPWNLKQLFKTPDVFETKDCKKIGLHAIYYQGLPYKGKETRVFAYYGLPKGASAKNKVPGVVLVHGGGGTAFDEWVRIWNRHGYAAIAMDLEGRKPTGVRMEVSKTKKRHKWAGPINAAFLDIPNESITDQWMYHAVADVILGNSLLRSFEQIDEKKIGITGISWGAIVSNLVIGLDDRFSFAVPVYGCSYLYEMEGYFRRQYKKFPPEFKKIQKNLWDGSNYLPNAKMPILWLNGTNDLCFFPPTFFKSTKAATGSKAKYMKIEMAHSHTHGWREPEIYAFADSITKKTDPLPEITNQGRRVQKAWITFDCKTPILCVWFNYTTHKSRWDKRKWHTAPVLPDMEKKKAVFNIPPKTTAYYFNITDTRGLSASSDLVIVR